MQYKKYSLWVNSYEDQLKFGFCFIFLLLLQKQLRFMYCCYDIFYYSISCFPNFCYLIKAKKPF